MIYTYSMIDDSPTRVFAASADLTGARFTAVTLGENGVATSAAGDVPIGILIAETELPVVQGEEVGVQVKGGSMWLVAEDVKAGDLLAAGEGGKAVKATSGTFALAQALENAAAGGTAHVLIVRCKA